MEELLINYGISKGKKITNIIIGAYLAIFSLYFCITEGIANHFDILFFCALAGFILAAILILTNTLWLPKPTLRISNEEVESHYPGQKSMLIEWTNVSQINIGVSYILFSVNGGQKQQKLDLSSLVYNDVKNIKSKVLELSEHKNIPYHND